MAKRDPVYAVINEKRRESITEFNRQCDIGIREANDLIRGFKRSKREMHTCHLDSDLDDLRRTIEQLYCCESIHDELVEAYDEIVEIIVAEREEARCIKQQERAEKLMEKGGLEPEEQKVVPGDAVRYEYWMAELDEIIRRRSLHNATYKGVQQHAF